MAVLRDVYLYRSYLGQKKFGLVEEEIGGGADERIKPIKTLAKYLKVNPLRLSYPSEGRTWVVPWSRDVSYYLAISLDKTWQSYLLNKDHWCIQSKCFVSLLIPG